MRTFWDSRVRHDFCRRVERLTPDSRAAWGTFTAAQMLAHLNDAMRMATGELMVQSRGGPLRYFPVKHVILYVLPFPKGAPTAPELLARCAAADFENERAAFMRVAEATGARPSSATWPEHPAFGTLTYAAWGKLIHKHTEHHLRQFGV